MTAHLLAISIGPVQDFIAAGRKTRDLWFGSYLLGEVSRAVATAVSQPGVELIFPDQNAVAAELPVANKILAWVGPDLDPSTIAASGRQSAQQRLGRFRDDALALPPPGALPAVDTDLLNAQLGDFLEFAAAWYPVDDASYKPSRTEVELLLAGRKALRDFAPAHGQDGVLKSSLDPARESVLRRGRDATEAERWRRGLRLKGAEQLDGISLIKRLAEPRRFVSVARVAIDPFIRRAHRDRPDDLATLADQAVRMDDARHPSVESFAAKLDEGLDRYAAFPFDTQLFYDDERSDPDLRNGWPIEQEQARDFFQAANTLRDNLQIAELPVYFAVLVADGDHMGAAIGALDDRDHHRALSRRLAGFAEKADSIVRECQGAMVYSGGDDVLAFLPLDRALDCADRLRQAFSQMMTGMTGETTVSLSVGVAIGHYGEHLQRLLEWGREVERAAKSPRDPLRPRETSRDALAVSLHTRGAGEGRIVVHPWREEPVRERWERWVTWHRCDLIPDSAAYELSRLAREFRALWPDPAASDSAASARREQLSDLLRREVIRVLGRRRAQHGEEAFDKTLQTALTQLVSGDVDALRRLSDELLIARRIAVVTDVAEGKPTLAACAQRLEREARNDDG